MDTKIIEIVKEIKEGRKQVRNLTKCIKNATSETEINNYKKQKKLLWEQQKELRKELDKLLDEV